MMGCLRNDMGRSGNGLIKMLSRRFLEGTEENHDKPQNRNEYQE
jgi:hypothetical protein